MKKAAVLKFFGGPAKTAKALGIKIGSVSGWPDIVPALRQCQIEELTGGKLKKQRDLWWPGGKRATA